MTLAIMGACLFAQINQSPQLTKLDHSKLEAIKGPSSL